MSSFPGIGIVPLADMVLVVGIVSIVSLAAGLVTRVLFVGALGFWTKLLFLPPLAPKSAHAH